MFKKILSVVTLLLVALIAYKAFSGEVEIDGQTMTMLEATWYSLQRINIWIVLLIIPEQILMYYAAGQIYFAFLRQRKNFKISQARLTRISLEINFVNHALPSGGESGLGFVRLVMHCRLWWQLLSYWQLVRLGGIGHFGWRLVWRAVLLVWLLFAG